MNFRVIRPQIFANIPNVDCFFTEANREAGLLLKKNQSIEGLNFGLNSSASEVEIEENYHTFFTNTGLNPSFLSIARQVHGNKIIVVNRPGIHDQADGLITSEKGLILCIQVADCAAILAADTDPQRSIAGAFHAGWKGALKGIVPDGISKMVQMGGDLSTIKVYISPSISVESFEVGKEVASQFPSEYCDNVSYEKPHIDLKGYIRGQLISSGIKEHHIECSPDCTVRDTRFYSFRRERYNAGRMLGVIRLTDHDSIDHNQSMS